ncbi:hypothetical protein [uncultured Algibacter sp.]|uniref:hypothetical protein n=1 Tax=uncultured Algibacter sp. TaxID=298659 RepID=UPI0026341044|nr:hypothetical protein [uncultured Algibacter sp.]
MKNIKTATIVILTSFLTLSCSTDNGDTLNDIYLDIPDSHFETILIEQGIDSDGIVNKLMLKSDAKKVNKLDLNLSTHFGEIADLTGIEGFYNISFLSAAGQNIKTIDLSFNTKLDTLYLNGNQLTSLDVSHNSNLILLDAQSNELNSILGLSKLNTLHHVNLSFNNFEEISIKNESIQILYISHNLLKSIDTKGAPNLKNLFIIINQLSAADFSLNTQLETLVISGNKLESVKLDQNASLTHLYSSSNLLTSLDVSNNAQLIDLRVDRNPELTCIKIENGQNIPTVSLSDYQNLNTWCN